MKNFAIDFILFLLASPILLVQWSVRMVKLAKFWKMAYTPYVPCHNCGARISLVGLFRCSCGYTYRGHVLRPCPVCHSLPRLLRCVYCTVTRLLPEEPS